MSEQELPIFAGKPLVPPTEALKAQAPMNPQAAEAYLAWARREPEAYWAAIAGELEWFRPWDAVREGGFPSFRYFPGATGNVSVNCVDRHARRHPDKVAIHWEREDGAHETWTYAELLDAVGRFANVLKGLGVRKGDRVGVYMANLPEAFVACHACYRIGAIYGVIFTGFSAQAVRERLEDARPRVVVAADASVRRGKRVPLKETLDTAMAGVPGIETVVVVRRMGGDIPLTPDRDLWYHDLMAQASPDCPPEPLEANEPGFLIHTSGTSAKPKGLIHAGMGFLVGTYANTKWSLLPQPDDVLWCTADVGWLTFPIWALVGGLANGATLVAYEGALDWPDPGHFYEVLERLRVSKVFTAPTALRMLRRAGDAWLEGRDLSRLTLISCVGEPLDPDTWSYFSRFPGRYNSFDAAILDPDGQVWVTGRVDDVINVAAHRIGTMEMEASLIGHPAVSEAAVVGVPDAVKGDLSALENPDAIDVVRSLIAG